MKKNKRKRISSKISSITTLSLIGCSIALLGMLFVNLVEKEFHSGMLLAIALTLAVVAFTYYFTMYGCSAFIDEDKLVLKKMFRPQKEYTFDKIEKHFTYRLKNNHFTNLKMKEANGELERYCIFSTYNIFKLNKPSISEVLNELQEKGQMV